MPEPVTTIRIWSSTQQKLEAIARLTGVTNYTRLLDALANGLLTLTPEQRLSAYQLSAGDVAADAEGTSRQVRRSTYEKLESLKHETGWPFVRVVDVMTHAWQQLDYERQRKAIADSAPNEADAA